MKPSATITKAPERLTEHGAMQGLGAEFQPLLLTPPRPPRHEIGFHTGD